MEYTAFKHAAWNPVHSIEIHWATLHGIHCNQSESTPPHCTESTAFNRDPLGHAAWNPVHSIGIHLTPLHGIHCINWCITPHPPPHEALDTTCWLQGGKKQTPLVLTSPAQPRAAAACLRALRYTWSLAHCRCSSAKSFSL